MENLNVIFDIDDTLVYTSKNAYKKAVVVAERMGLKSPTREEFFAVYGKFSFEECVVRLHPGVDLGIYKDEYDSTRRLIPYEKIGDVDEVLGVLQTNDCGTGILSNGSGLKIKLKLEALGVVGSIRERLLFVFHCDNNPYKKPDSRCFDPIFEHIDRGHVENTFYVGDCLDDYVASMGAGLNFVAVTSGYTTRDSFIEEGLSDDRIIGSINEILPYFGL